MLVMKRKVVCLNIQQKKEICIYHNNNLDKTQQQIANIFSVKYNYALSRRTIGDILANKSKWLNQASNNLAKKIRTGKHAVLEDVLQMWLVNMKTQQGGINNNNVVVTDTILREKAKLFGASLNIGNDFQYSNGWLQRFKKRCGINITTMAATAVMTNNFTTSAIEDLNDVIAQCDEFRQRVLTILGEYALCDIYNLDECALYYRMPPYERVPLFANDKPTVDSDDNHDYITVMLCANADGSDKMKPAIIGRCSRDANCMDEQFNSRLYCDYYRNSMAWMIMPILTDFLMRLNTRMVQDQRHIVIFMDNAPCHILPTEFFTNIRIEILPNHPQFLQPMSVGIVHAFKAYYRRHQLQHSLLESTTRQSTISEEIGITDAIRWSSMAWNEVPGEVIRSCWQGSDIFNHSTTTFTSTNNNLIDVSQILRDIEALKQQLTIPEEFSMSACEFVEIDKELNTSDCVNETELVDVMETNQALNNYEPSPQTKHDFHIKKEMTTTEEEEDDDDVNGSIKQHCTIIRVNCVEARHAINTLFRYFEMSPSAIESDIELLCAIKNRMEQL